MGLSIAQRAESEKPQLEALKHVMRYALAVYGWPLYLYEHICLGALRLMLGACCSRPGENVLGDNCCSCHFSALNTRV